MLKLPPSYIQIVFPLPPKKCLFYNCVDGPCLFFQMKALFFIEANVNGAYAPRPPVLLSPEPEGIQTAYFYTY